MEAQVPKKSRPPEPDFSNLPGLADMLRSIVPRQIPQIEYDPSFLAIFQNFKHNWVLGQIRRETERLADIAENNCRLVKAQTESLMHFITIPEQIQTYRMRIRHEARMMQIEEDKAEAEVDGKRMTNLISKGEYDRLMTENRVMSYQLEQKNVAENENGKDE